MARDPYEYSSRKHTTYDEIGSDDEDEKSELPRRRKRRPLLVAAVIVTVLILVCAAIWLWAWSDEKDLSSLFEPESNTSSSATLPKTSSPNETTDSSPAAPSATRSAESAAKSSTSTLESSTSTPSRPTTAAESLISTGNSSTTAISADKAAAKSTDTNAELEPSPTAGSTTPSSGSADTYWTKEYSGIATYFEGGAAPLSCGDVYPDTKSVLFAALCHTLYDSVPDNADPSAANRSPVCGDYVAGRKGLQDEWIGKESDSWVIVGGDGKLNCVGTEAVRCHVPRTVAVTLGSVTVSGVAIVDRNAATCGLGDIDLSEKAFLGLGDPGGLDAGKLEVTWKWE